MQRKTEKHKTRKNFQPKKNRTQLKNEENFQLKKIEFNLKMRKIK